MSLSSSTKFGQEKEESADHESSARHTRGRLLSFHTDMCRYKWLCPMFGVMPSEMSNHVEAVDIALYNALESTGMLKHESTGRQPNIK